MSVRWVHLTVREAKTGSDACPSNTRGLVDGPQTPLPTRGAVIIIVPTRRPHACGNGRQHPGGQPHALGSADRVETVVMYVMLLLASLAER